MQSSMLAAIGLGAGPPLHPQTAEVEAPCILSSSLTLEAILQAVKGVVKGV